MFFERGIMIICSHLKQILNGCYLRIIKDSLTLFIVFFCASSLDVFLFCSYLDTLVYSSKGLITMCPSYVPCY